MTTSVQPLQVWADNDPRCHGTTLVVNEVDNRWAYCTVLTPRHGSKRTGHQVRIPLERMRPTSTGYRLIEEVPEP